MGDWKSPSTIFDELKIHGVDPYTWDRKRYDLAQTNPKPFCSTDWFEIDSTFKIPNNNPAASTNGIWRSDILQWSQLPSSLFTGDWGGVIQSITCIGLEANSKLYCLGYDRNTQTLGLIHKIPSSDFSTYGGGLEFNGAPFLLPANNSIAFFLTSPSPTLLSPSNPVYFRAAGGLY